MYMDKKILAIIPARGGSKGIPKKNIKLLNGKPLIHYTIEKLIKINKISKIIVSTDSEEIINSISKFKEVEIYKRPDKLSTDLIPLDPVILDVVKNQKEKFDYIFTFNPTSPLISKKTIIKCIDYVINNQIDSFTTALDIRHLIWYETGNKFKLIHGERKNRQELKPIIKEIGAIVGCSFNYLINTGKRVSDNPKFYLISEEEAIDIDSYKDWQLAELILNQFKIGILAEDKYIINSIKFANNMNSKPIFLTDFNSNKSINKINTSYYNSEKNLKKVIKKEKLNLIISFLDNKKIEKLNIPIINISNKNQNYNFTHNIYEKDLNNYKNKDYYKLFNKIVNIQKNGF